MVIKIVKEKITKEELKEIAKEFYQNMVKAVVDINQGIMAVGGELHVDSNEVLIKQGSNQKDLWGINIFLDRPRENYLEFYSMINIRPQDGNPQQEIQLPGIKDKIFEIVNKLIL